MTDKQELSAFRLNLQSPDEEVEAKMEGEVDEVDPLLVEDENRLEDESQPEENINELNGDSTNGFECKYCRKRFGFRYSLVRHLKVIHDPGHQAHLCDGCGRSFVWKSALQRHLRGSCVARSISNSDSIDMD